MAQTRLDSTTSIGVHIDADGFTVHHHAASQARLDAFYERLTAEYTDLFANDPEYAYSAANITPAALARKMTLGLDRGQANKDGAGIRHTCQHFGIPYTYRAIRAFLNGEAVAHWSSLRAEIDARLGAQS